MCLHIKEEPIDLKQQLNMKYKFSKLQGTNHVTKSIGFTYTISILFKIETINIGYYISKNTIKYLAIFLLGILHPQTVKYF